MSDFVLLVDFELKPGSAGKFLTLVAENARLSVELEPDCLQFDVMQQEDDENRVTLYEVFRDAAAFEAHTKFPHVASFFAEAKSLFVTRTARRLKRTASHINAAQH